MADRDQLSVLVELIDKVSGPLGEIAGHLQGFGKTVEDSSNVASAALKYLGSAAVIGAVVESVRELTKAGIEQQQSVHDLSQSIKSMGRDWETYRGTLERVTDTLREATAFDDSDIRAGLTGIIQMTGDVELAEKAVAAAADMAAARHTDLASAAIALSRGIEGVGRGLRAYGIILDSHEQKLLAAMDATERFDFLQGKINEKFGGAASAQLDTFIGQWEHLKNTLHELMETAGAPLAAIATNFLTWLNDAVDKMSSFISKFEAVGELVGYYSTGGRSRAPGYEFGYTPGDFNAGHGATGTWEVEEYWPGGNKAIQARIRAEAALAKETTKAWKSELDKLVDSLNDLERQWADASGAGVTWDAFVQANADHLKKLAEQVGYGGVELDEFAEKAIKAGNALRTLPVGEEGKGGIAQWIENIASQGGRYLPTAFGPYDTLTGQFDPKFLAKAAEESDRFYADEAGRAEHLEQQRVQIQLRNAQRIADFYRQNVLQPFEDAFADLATTGGKNLANIFVQSLASNSRMAGGGLLDIFRNWLTGGDITQTGTDSQGQPIYSYGGRTYTGLTGFGQAQQDQNNANANFGAYGNAALALGGFGVQASMGMTPIQGAMAGLSAGSAVGTAIGGTVGGLGAGAFGGLIGVFVGALVAALTETVPTITTYARPIIKNGIAMLTDVIGEIAQDPEQQKALLQKIQTQFDFFRNNYIEIFLSLPKDLRDTVLPQVVGIVRQLATHQLPTGPFNMPYTNQFPTPGNGTDYMSAADVQAMWNNWINTTMPSGVMEVFKPAFQTLFDGMGVTVEKFDEIWAKAAGLDPKAALQYLNDYVDVLSSLQDLVKKLKEPIGFGRGGSGLYTEIVGENGMSFADRLRKSDQDIKDFAAGIELLTGQAQLDRTRQLNQMIQQRYDSEREYIQQLIDMMNSAKQQLSGDILGLQMQGKTPQQQYDILKAHLSDLEAQLRSATNEQQASSVYQQIRSTILQMAGLFPNDARINAWAQTELQSQYDIFATKLQGWGNSIDDVNSSLVNDLDPSIRALTETTDQFNLDLTAASDGVGALNLAATTAADSLNALAEAAMAFTETLNANGYTAQQRRARAA